MRKWLDTRSDELVMAVVVISFPDGDIGQVTKIHQNRRLLMLKLFVSNSLSPIGVEYHGLFN